MSHPTSSLRESAVAPGSASTEDLDLLRLPFDQYQRYRTAADLLGHLAGPAVRVLEVGGAPGPIERFLPEADVFIIDRYGEHTGRYAIADGARLPFADQTFDAVIALDTLEHVPAKDRPAFLAEARRVSKDLVILSAPFADTDVVLAEDALHEFIKQRFGGDFATLQEHRDHGLPVLAATLDAMAFEGWSAASLPSGYLPRWLLGMVFHHELLASGLSGLDDLHAYYNRTVSPLDCRAPAYRQIVLASRVRAVDELEAAAGKLVVDGSELAAKTALASIASAVLAHRLAGNQEVERLREKLAARDAEVVSLERIVADREAHLVELRAQIERLMEYLEARSSKSFLKRS